MIPRLAQKNINQLLSTYDKILLLLGARQVGKTTLLLQLKAQLEKQGKSTLYINADIEEDRAVIDTTSRAKLKQLTDNKDFILIDEAQRLNTPGLTLKIIKDNLVKTRVIATGSSSFQLKNNMVETLTGRYVEATLYSLSFAEVADHIGLSENKLVRQEEAKSLIPSLLVWGGYPEIYLEKTAPTKELLLKKIVDSYLFRDILMYQRIRHSQAIINLASAVAYQVGQEVNENELASRLKIDRKTVSSYLDILEQSFVIIRLHPYSRNPRREIGRKYKIFFLDLGIRNALIGDFHNLKVRSDTGALWENFCIIERIKHNTYHNRHPNYFFWRTYSGAELDLVEEQGGKLYGFEFKYGNKIARPPKKWLETYENSRFECINMDTFLPFIT